MSDRTLGKKRLWSAAGALPAVVLVYVVWRHVDALRSHITLPGNDPAPRLAFVVHWLLLPALALLAGVMAASGWRGVLPGAIDGSRTPAHHAFEITLRYNQNTIEQLVLAAIAWAGVGLAAQTRQLVVIPAMALLFVVGRITFWVGYLVHPQARAFPHGGHRTAHGHSLRLADRADVVIASGMSACFTLRGANAPRP
jgi:hypothetical protein